MTLFLDGIYNLSDNGFIPPSAIRVDFPKVIYGGQSFQGWDQIQGLLVNEVTISSQIKWGSILSDVSNLQDVASLLGSPKMWTWIGASTMCWKGTEPLKTSFEFYLINYKRGLKLEEKLKDLNLLAALMEDPGSSGRWWEQTVAVHGGYGAHVLDSTNQFLTNGNTKKDRKKGEYNIPADYASIAQGDLESGTLRIRLGNKLRITNMLLHRLDVTPSIIELPDGLPLYYRVSLSVTGAQPLLGRQVEEMYPTTRRII